MRIFAQQGYGKEDKIQAGLSMDTIDGMIMSPRDNKYENLLGLDAELIDNYPHAEIYIDPKFHYPACQGSSNKESYMSQDSISLTDLTSPKKVYSLIKESFEYQKNFHVACLISPSIFIPSFTSSKTPISLNMAKASIELAKQEYPEYEILVSLTFDESSLFDQNIVNYFLNKVATLDADGFYITVSRRTSDYDQLFESETALANLLTLIYSLAGINKYKVIMGYSDIIGLLYLATGAYGISTGWDCSSRKFNIKRKLFPTDDGQLSIEERYTSIPLLNSISLSELDSIASKVGRTNLSPYLSSDYYDSILTSSSIPSGGWAGDIIHFQHWTALKKATNSIFSNPYNNISDHLNDLSQAIVEAKELYANLESLSVQFERASSNEHLNIWESAITEFRMRHHL